MRVRSRLAVLATAALLGLSLAAPAAVSAQTEYYANLSADEVVPGPGDSGAGGLAILTFDPAAGNVCVFLDDDLTEDIGQQTLHIWQGAEGEVGTDVLTVTLPAELGISNCANGYDSAVLEAIAADPGGHYAQVATDSFPGGAIRGQLGSYETVGVVWAYEAACPAEYPTLQSLLDAGGPAARCLPVRTVSLPSGYTLSNEVVEWDPDFELTDGFGDTYGTDVATFFGDGQCDPQALTCTLPIGAYTWSDLPMGVPAGEMSIRQLSAPTGWEFGYGMVTLLDGTPVPSTWDADSGTVSFTTTGEEVDVLVWILDLPEGTAATPTPAPTATVIDATLPPTDLGDARTGRDGRALPFIGLLALVGLSLIVISRRRATAD